MFKEQAVRLLREKWGSVNLLAEELYAILSTEKDLVHEGGVTLQPDGTDEPAAKLRRFGDDAIILRITRKNGDEINFTLDDLVDALQGNAGGADAAVVSALIVSKIDNSTYNVTVGLLEYEATCIPELPADEEIPAGTEVALTIIQTTDEEGEAQTSVTFTVPVWL